MHKNAQLLDLDSEELSEYPATATFEDLRVREMIKVSVTYDI